MGKALTVSEAYEIAKKADSLVGYGSEHAGDCRIYEYDEYEVVTGYVYKEVNDNKHYYTVYIVDDRYTGNIYHTDSLKTSDLANLLYEISQCCIEQEKYPRTIPAREYYGYAISA